jgi:hypothetical protein
LWVSGEDAVNSKHADKLANVQCDRSLIEETHKQQVTTIFGKVNIIFSKCPLISAPIDFSFEKDVKPEDMPKVKKLIEVKKKNVSLTF